MSYLFKGLPTCPTILTSSDVANWNASNKVQWVPLTFNQVMRLYYGVKSCKCSKTSVAQKYVTLAELQWNGTLWEDNPSLDPFDINFAASETGLVASAVDSASLVEYNFITRPSEFICNTIRFFLMEETVSPDDTTFLHRIRFDFCAAAIPRGTSISSAKLLYDPNIETFYVPIRAGWRLNINPDVYYINTNIGTGPPPTPQYDSAGGASEGRLNLSWFTTSDDPVANCVLSVNIFGSIATLQADTLSEGVGVPFQGQFFNIEITEDDTTLFFDPNG